MDFSDDDKVSNKSSKSKRGFGLKKLKSGKVKIIIVLVLLLAVGGGFAYQVRATNNLKKENARLSNPQEAAKAETEKIKAEVANIIELPANETPTIATVVDASKLKTQAFFANAQNGDRVLMFSEAKKAILYRPSTKKIIEVAPINIGSGTTDKAAPTTTTPTTKKP